MYFTLTPSSAATSTPFSPYHPQHFLFNLSHSRHLQTRKTFSIKSVHVKETQNQLSIPGSIGAAGGPIRHVECSKNSILLSESKNEGNSDDSLVHFDGKNRNLLGSFAKPVAFTLLWVVLGLCPIRGFECPAIAIGPRSVEVLERKKSKGEGEELSRKGHEYSDYTRRLLELVSGLVRAVEEVRSGNGNVKSVEMALKLVKTTKKDLQKEIMGGLYAQLRVLKGEKEVLMKRSEVILDDVFKVRRKRDGLLKKVSSGGEGANLEKLEEEMRCGEEDYNGIWERIGEIEDQILRRETMVLSIGVRELSSIERECELLVEELKRELRRQEKAER